MEHDVLGVWAEVACPDHRAKKVLSDSLGLVDFAIGLVNSVFNLSNGQVIFFLRNLNDRRTVKSILPVKKFLGLVEMTCYM